MVEAYFPGETGDFVELVDLGFGCCSGSGFGSDFDFGLPLLNFCSVLGSAELTSRFRARKLTETVGPNDGCA